MTKDNKVKRLNLTKFFKDFDETNDDDMMRLTTLIQDKAAEHPEFKNYTVLRIDGDFAVIAPMGYNTEDSSDGVKTIGIDVNQGSDLAQQKKTVPRLEAEYPGYFVTDFMRPEAAKCYVRLEQLDEKTLSSRRIFADALNLQPWQIRISRTPEKGWRLRIKEGATTYQASKYDVKMQEAVNVVGKDGWFFKADPESGVITVYPGKPPTFKKTISMPKNIWTEPDIRRSYFGMKLPDKGRTVGDPLANDWKNAAFVLVCGESGGGKSVIINSLIYGSIIAGCELYLGDDKGKSTDYNWCRDYVSENGYGADGLESTAAMLIYLLKKVEERAKIWHDNGWINWWGLPAEAKKKYPRILLVMDEISQLDVPARLPTGVDKDNPDVIRKKYENSVKFSIQESMLQIVQKARYVGVTAIYAAQSATQDAGIPPLMRTNLQSKIIVGEKVPDATRKSVLKDPKTAPVVPINVIKEGVGMGTGIAELAGQEACVFKGYYEESDGKDWAGILAERARSIRPVDMDPAAGYLSWKTIISLFPTAADKPDDGSQYENDESDSDDREPSRLETEGGFGIDGRDVADRDAPLKGAAKAAHGLRITGIEAARTLAVQSAEAGF